jgi:MFS family permease
MNASTAVAHGRADARRLPLPFEFAAVAAVIGVALFAAATPSPLYDLYQARWHFSTPVLSLVYAVYAFGVLSSLLLVGGISDQAGRRPVLIWSLLALLISMLVLSAASSVAWLFAGRAIQGLATGAVLSAAGAALIDLHPSSDARHAALVNGVVTLAGLGAGALASATLVRLLPAPRVLPYVLVVVMILLLLALVGVLREPVPDPRRPSLRPRRPSVPRSARGPFLLAGLDVLSSWSIVGLYLALGPGLAEHLLGSHDALVGGIAVTALMAPGALAQLAGRDLSNRTLTAAGAALIALGVALIAGSAAGGSAAVFLSASALAGIGLGLGFTGALRHLSEAIPPNRRGEVMSAFYVVGYLSLALPAIAAGLTASALGLSATFELFGAAAALLALALAISALRIDQSTPRRLDLVSKMASAHG